MVKSIDYSFKRGDTQVLKKFRVLDENNQPTTLTEAEQLYFTVKKTANDSTYVFQKKIGSGINLGDDGFYHITINPSDTNSLSYGDYVYDIELKSTTEERTFVKTIIEGTITLEEEVTWGVNE